MTDEQALKIITDRRGTMYDPLVVDTFVATYQRVMPAPETAPHPVARVIGDARALDRREPRRARRRSPAGGEVTDGLLAVTSLSRALTGQAGVADVGALIWMIVRQVLPCEAMAIFLPDERNDHDCHPLRRRSECGGASRHQPAQRVGDRRVGGRQPPRRRERRRHARSGYACRRHGAGAPLVSGDSTSRRRRARRGSRLDPAIHRVVF